MQQNPDRQSEQSERRAESGAAESPEIVLLKKKEEYRDLMTNALTSMREARELGKGIGRESTSVYDKEALRMKSGYNRSAAEVLIKAAKLRVELTKLGGEPKSERDIIDAYKGALQLTDSAFAAVEEFRGSDDDLVERVKNAKEPVFAEKDALGAKLKAMHPNEKAMMEDDNGRFVDGTLFWTNEQLDDTVRGMENEANSIQRKHSQDFTWKHGGSAELVKFGALQAKISEFRVIQARRASVNRAPDQS